MNHTNNAPKTVDRIINVFPSDKQSHVRTMLSTSLRGVVSQQLLQKADKNGRVAALEILVNTPAAANLIRQGKLDQLENVMQAGGALGMRAMDTATAASGMWCALAPKVRTMNTTSSPSSRTPLKARVKP